MGATHTLQHLHVLMLLLLCSCSMHASSANTTAAVPCLADQASALLHLKRSFTHANLPSWRDGEDCCHWEGVACDTASGRVISLNLSAVDATIRRVGPALLNLTSLKSLSLSTACISKGLSSLSKLPSLNNLELHGPSSRDPVGPELSSVGDIRQLTSLRLEGYDFSRSRPSWIGNLTGLAHLRMHGCDFTGPVPDQIGTLAKLTLLDFENCNYAGQPVPSWIGNLTRLTKLGVQGCRHSGSIPSTIANLTRLEVIRLGNNNLVGKIPQSLFALPALRALSLKNNQLSGHLEDIPSPIYSSLSKVEINDNQLTGHIPKSILQLKHIKYLNLESNRLSGTIKLSSFWRLERLYFLSLSNNKLSIIVEEEEVDVLNSLPNICYLYLASCNLTKFPSSLRYLDKVSVLDLSSNQINDVIPSWVWGNWKDQLECLNLSRNMFTALEKFPSLVHMSRLTVLDLSFNRLQGSIPIPVTAMSGNVLDYSNNNFSSILHDFGRYIRSFYLDLSKNKLNGHVPSSICRASHLNILDLSYNNFSGSLPSCLIGNGKLAVLKLRENQFSGTLPENITEECKFRTIDLNRNQIEGELPRSLSNCQELELLDLGNNQVRGSFPSWLGILPKLRVLVLRSNQLNGTIKDLDGDHGTINQFPSLQILCLGSNRFHGHLPKGWFNKFKAMMENVNEEGRVLGYYTNTTHGFYKDTVTITLKGSDLIFTKILTTFKAIDFSDNSFDGHFPESIGNLVSLHGVNMSSNNFTGQMPSSFSNLSQLESLDLSWNQISGEIPQLLTSLTSLAWLNLSYNNLVGRIPQGNQFLSFPNSSFEGNMGLCGSPLSKQCETASSALTPPEPQDRLDAILHFTFIGLGFGVGFASAITFRMFFHIEGLDCNHW
ncbi:receptor like protein 22-like [Hordeum vulgare subsp. vulgare]|uniref:Leucine-rich repeat-containing N-terminal plant-type domain-containing protein n=1 Tax=Hordeum vulgare subsp. vulgare TaxID=112509 RepID=A0A8I7BB23_HORVV|nr:receptor like protein 22-like [Hordeum vulgare subsp. vulgare]